MCGEQRAGRRVGAVHASHVVASRLLRATIHTKQAHQRRTATIKYAPSHPQQVLRPGLSPACQLHAPLNQHRSK